MCYVFMAVDTFGTLKRPGRCDVLISCLSGRIPADLRARNLPYPKRTKRENRYPFAVAVCCCSPVSYQRSALLTDGVRVGGGVVLATCRWRRGVWRATTAVFQYTFYFSPTPKNSSTKDACPQNQELARYSFHVLESSHHTPLHLR